MNKIGNLYGTRRLAPALAVAVLLIAFCPAATNGDEPLPKGHYKLLERSYENYDDLFDVASRSW